MESGGEALKDYDSFRSEIVALLLQNSDSAVFSDSNNIAHAWENANGKFMDSQERKTIPNNFSFLHI